MVNRENFAKMAKVFAHQEVAAEKGIGYNQGTFSRCSGVDWSGNECGTSCCIAGWTVAALAPREYQGIEHNGGKIMRKAASLLGLTSDEQNVMFASTANPHGYSEGLATCTVAAMLKRVAEGEPVSHTTWAKAAKDAKEANGKS